MSEKTRFWILSILLILSVVLVWYINSSYSHALLGNL
jgi:hypothetical protein